MVIKMKKALKVILIVFLIIIGLIIGAIFLISRFMVKNCKSQVIALHISTLSFANRTRNVIRAVSIQGHKSGAPRQ